MDGRLIWIDCDEAGYYVVPNVLSPRDLVSRPDNMDGTVPHTHALDCFLMKCIELNSIDKARLFMQVTIIVIKT